MTITNNLQLIANIKQPVLNLSTSSIKDKEAIDISEKIFYYKDILRADYETTLTNLNEISSNSLFYHFSDLGWNSYFKHDTFILIIYYFIFLDYVKNNKVSYVFIESVELINFIRMKNTSLNLKFKVKMSLKKRVKSFFRPYFYMFKLCMSKLKYGKTDTAYNNARILFYSYPLDKCFINDKQWEDSFFNDLYDEIKLVEPYTYRFSPLEPNCFLENMYDRRSYLIALINYFNYFDIIKILFSRQNRSIKFQDVKLIINNVNFNSLFEFSLNEYQQTNDFYLRYSFYYVFKKFIEQVKPKVVLYPYENQPWEKTINIVCNKLGIKTIAIQHSLLCKDMFYLYNKGLSKEVLPTTLMSNGEYGKKVLEYMNDDIKIYNIGTKRHNYSMRVLSIRKNENIWNVAIMLSNENELCDIINCLNQNINKLKQYVIYFKPPPEPYESQFYKQYIALKKNIKFKHEFLIGKTLEQVFNFCETIVFLSTTVGIEAYIKNKITIRYSPSSNYDLNLTEDIQNGIYFAKYHNFFDILNQAIEKNIDNEKIDTEYFFKSWDKKEFDKLLMEHLI